MLIKHINFMLIKHTKNVIFNDETIRRRTAAVLSLGFALMTINPLMTLPSFHPRLLRKINVNKVNINYS